MVSIFAFANLDAASERNARILFKARILDAEASRASEFADFGPITQKLLQRERRRMQSADTDSLQWEIELEDRARRERKRKLHEQRLYEARHESRVNYEVRKAMYKEDYDIDPEKLRRRQAAMRWQ